MKCVTEARFRLGSWTRRVLCIKALTRLKQLLLDWASKSTRVFQTLEYLIKSRATASFKFVIFNSSVVGIVFNFWATEDIVCYPQYLRKNKCTSRQFYTMNFCDHLFMPIRFNNVKITP